MGYQYKPSELAVLSQFAGDQPGYAPMETYFRDNRYSPLAPVLQGPADIHTPADYQYNEMQPEGPAPFFRDRNSSQFNTDWHLPPHLFKFEKRAVTTEELFGPPVPTRVDPTNGNFNFYGTLRNYTSLADKARSQHGAYNGYAPPIGDPATGIPSETGPYCPTVWDGYSNGLEKTERRRPNYWLYNVPTYLGEQLRGLVSLTPPMANAFPNRSGGSSAPFMGWGTPLKPYGPLDGLGLPPTHASVGERPYRRNEGVGEIAASFPQYRPEWVGYQRAPVPTAEVMRPQNRLYADLGERWVGGVKHVRCDDDAPEMINGFDV